MQMPKQKGILTVVSGFSGSGKGTVMSRLLSAHPEYGLSISVTTRAPRQGEEDGREYFFRTKEYFEQMIENDKLLEYAQYVDNYYGTPREYVQRQLDEGRDVILEIEMQGARQVKRRFPEAVLVFITPPSIEELENRLRGRGTETEEVIRGRLAQAAKEAEAMEDYDYILPNEDGGADKCAEDLHRIICSEHFKVARNKERIENFKGETYILKGETK